VILVTGGTGLVGRAVVQELLQNGFVVRCLVRDPAKARFVLGDGPALAPGDVTDYPSLQRAAADCAGVVHLVAIIRERGAATFRQINVAGTANVVRAATAAGARRFIHMSALGVKPGPAYRYAHSKWEAEEIVRNSSLAWTILRPSVVFGPGFGFFDRMEQSVRLSPPPFVFYPASKTLFQPVAAADVARCVRLALEDPRTIRRTIDLGGPEHLTYREMLDIFLAAKKIRRLKIPVPVCLLRLVVPVMEKLLPDPPVTAVELKQMGCSSVTAPDSVEKEFGFKPAGLHEGLAALYNGKRE